MTGASDERQGQGRRPRPSIRSALIGCAALVAAIAAGAAIMVESGLYNVAAASPHFKPTYWLLQTAMRRSVQLRASGIAVPGLGVDAARAGFCDYERHCVACHGALTIGRAHWIEGMDPAPPWLAAVPQRWTPGEAFWIIRNGVKSTGMPAWNSTLDDRQVWNLVAFLWSDANRQPGAYLKLRQASICPPGR